MPLNSVQTTTPTESRTRALTTAQADYLFPWVRPYYSEPLALSNGEGVWVRDVEGDEYLDLFAGILTTSVGHCNPVVLEAVREQMGRLGHTSALYVTEGQIEAARSLAEITPGALRTACFTNSGTEAVEAAVATARLYTGRHEIVALRLSYSGRSTLTSHMTAQRAWRLPGGATDGVVHARSPYAYRSPVGDGPESTKFFIDDLVEVIETTTGGSRPPSSRRRSRAWRGSSCRRRTTSGRRPR
ncbi:aminotransferase class III-fold pyridoxal phosphate-dependent enzyme [Candidatus Palauibacter sp.]|uniref:aminotransferase class III-fold pyridoxal phosphate-dependent enzyme n=1 Tax=Candidatus Palauibacter sp. TaxID=3101350 RepID=UPI003B01A3DF